MSVGARQVRCINKVGQGKMLSCVRYVSLGVWACTGVYFVHVCVYVCRGQNSELKSIWLFRRQLVLSSSRDLFYGSNIAWCPNVSEEARNQYIYIKYHEFLILAQNVTALCSRLQHKAIPAHPIWLVGYQLRKKGCLEGVGTWRRKKTMVKKLENFICLFLIYWKLDILMTKIFFQFHHYSNRSFPYSVITLFDCNTIYMYKLYHEKQFHCEE